MGTWRTLKIPFLCFLGRRNAGCSVYSGRCFIFSHCSQVGNCAQFVLLNLCCYLGGFRKLAWFMKQSVQFLLISLCSYLMSRCCNHSYSFFMTAAPLKVYDDLLVKMLSKQAVSLANKVFSWSTWCSEIEERWGNHTRAFIYICVCV